MAVGIDRASLLQTSAFGMSGYFTAMLCLVIFLTLLTTLFRHRGKVAKSSPAVVMEPLMATEASQSKKRPQRQRKKARRGASKLAKLQSNAIETGVHENDSAIEDTDVEAAGGTVVAFSNRQLEVEADLEANNSSSTGNAVFTPPTIDLSAEMLTTFGEAPHVEAAFIGVFTESDLSSAIAIDQSCTYNKHLLLMHRDIAKRIAQGPPGLELDCQIVGGQHTVDISTLACSSLARRQK